MKKIIKITSAALIIGSITTTSITAFAATDSVNGFSNRLPSLDISERLSYVAPSTRNRVYVKSERAELTEEQKAEMLNNMKERLAKLLEEGKISQGNYDQAIADIVAGKEIKLKIENRLPMIELTEEQKAEKLSEMKEHLAKLLEEGEISQERYDQIIADIVVGKPIKFKVENRLHMTELTEEQKAEKLTAMKEHLAKLLEEGEISQERYDQAIADIVEGKSIQLMVENRLPMTELTEEQKAEKLSEMKEHLSKLLDEGKISEGHYDQAIADIVAGKAIKLKIENRRPMTELTDEQKTEMLNNMKERFAKLLNEGKISQEEYDQTIADIAEGKVLEFKFQKRAPMTELTEEQKNEMLVNMKERLAKLLEEGRITQEQYDQSLVNIAEGNYRALKFDKGSVFYDGKLISQSDSLN